MALPSDSEDLKLLRQADSVYEDGVPESYARYIEGGGSKDEANMALVESFQGLPLMVNMLSKWLRVIGGDPDEVMNATLTPLLKQSFAVRLADKAYEKLLASPKTDEALSFLGEVAGSKYWTAIIAGETKFKGSPLMDGLLQQEGMSKDALTSMKSPEACISSFVSLLDELLMKASITANDLRLFYDTVSERATYDENTMVLTLRVIHGIRSECADEDLKQMLRRCSQEVCKRAAAKVVETHGIPEREACKYVFTMTSKLEIFPGKPSLPEAVVSDLWAVADVRMKRLNQTQVEVNHSAVKRIQELYGGLSATIPAEGGTEDDVVQVPVIPDAERTMYLSVLCHPELLRCMMKKLFVQSFRSPFGEPGIRSPLDSNERPCLCMLVSLAHTFQCSRASSAEGESVPLTRDEEREKAQDLEQKLLRCVVTCEALCPQGWDRLFREKARDGVAHADVLREGIKESVVIARGVVLWAREGLLTAPRPERLRTSAGWYVELLELVAEMHAMLREDVLDLLMDAYGRDLWQSKTDLARNTKQEETIRMYYSTALVGLLRLQMGTQVIKTYREKFAARDSAIEALYLREFVLAVMERIDFSNPVAMPFAEALLSLLREERILAAFRALEGKQDAKLISLKKYVEEFAKGCASMTRLVSEGGLKSVQEAYEKMAAQ